MKKFKSAPQPTPPNRASGSTPDRGEIDAAIQALTHFIARDPKKAAKIFETWLTSPGEQKKSPSKKSAA